MDPTPVTTERQRHPRLVLAIAALGVFVVFLDTTVLFVAFPDIRESFAGVGRAQLSWVLNGYTIVFGALLIPAGRIADRVGRRTAFVAAVLLFTVASLACGLAPNAGTLIAFRVLQAVGGALLIPSSLAVVLGAFPRARVPFAVAVWGATGATAGALGPTLGALLVEHGGWRWVFYLNLPIGLFAAVAGRRVLPESREPDPAPLPNPLGVGLLIGAVALISLGVVQSEDWTWADPRTLGALAAGAALAVAFVIEERTARVPVVPRRVLADTDTTWANAAMFTYAVAFAAMFLGFVLFLTGVWEYSVLEAGLAITPGPALVAVLAPFAGRAAMRIGQRPLLLVGGVVYAAAGLWAITQLTVEPSLPRWLVMMLLTGLGVALVFPQLASAATQGLAATDRGVGAAVNQSLRQIGQTMGVALAVALLGSRTAPADLADRFDLVWSLLVLSGVGVVAIASRLGRRIAVRPAPATAA